MDLRLIDKLCSNGCHSKISYCDERGLGIPPVTKPFHPTDEKNFLFGWKIWQAINWF